MEMKHRTGISIGQGLLIVIVAEECQGYPVRALLGLDDVWDILLLIIIV